MSLILDGSNGETFPTWTTATRPSSPNTNQLGYNSTYGGYELWNGSAWSTISGGPAFSAYPSGTQAISNSTFTKLQFNTKLFDTNNNYDNATNYRFTPTVAGYYQCNLSVNSQTSTTTTLIAIYKNGSSYLLGLQLPASTFQVGSMSALIFMNGSTDYIEAYFYGSATTINSGSGGNQFSAYLVRGQ